MEQELLKLQEELDALLELVKKQQAALVKIEVAVLALSQGKPVEA